MSRIAGGIARALVLLALIACPWLAYLAVSGDVTGPLRLALAVPHAAIYFFLLWWFGRTLQRDSEPLITGIARRVHGTLAPEIEAYTRRVTLAWCGFFAAQIVVSALLVAFAPLDIWSLFVGVLNIPLIALMFVGEHLYCVARYPGHPRASIANALRAFAGRDSAVTGAKAR
jgi:uncharacterized membrane protein